LVYPPRNKNRNGKRGRTTISARSRHSGGETVLTVSPRRGAVKDVVGPPAALATMVDLGARLGSEGQRRGRTASDVGTSSRAPATVPGGRKLKKTRAGGGGGPRQLLLLRARIRVRSWWRVRRILGRRLLRLFLSLLLLRLSLLPLILVLFLLRRLNRASDVEHQCCHGWCRDEWDEEPKCKCGC
jgi:hypothetical protein